MKRIFVVGMFAVFCTAAGIPGVAADRRQGDTAVEVKESGAETYANHCAACHGRGGLGDGPVAPTLRQKPANLTTIAHRRGGSFPRTEVMDFVLGNGKRVGAHGTRDMPVWGPFFRTLNPSGSNVDVRVTRLVDYLESIQVK
jgi:mono/diheme cytochrome c family protein